MTIISLCENNSNNSNNDNNYHSQDSRSFQAQAQTLHYQYRWTNHDEVQSVTAVNGFAGNGFQ
jgi:hypothetical protein